MSIYKNISRKMPGLALKLKQAAIYDEPEFYIKKIVFNSVIISVSICFIAFMFTNSFVTFPLN